MPIFLKIVKNKWFWIGLGLLIIIFYVWRNWDKLKSKFGVITGDFQPGDITDKRKGTLESLAQDTYDSIYSATGDTGDTLEKVNALNDSELDYLARYYKKALTRGNTLYEDVDDEFMPWDDVDETLMGKLNRLGLM